MLRVTSQELQKQIGEVQMEASRSPVIITSHGRPRNVLMSTQEFMRLKELAGEPVVIEGHRKRAATIRGTTDPLGYDVSDSDAAMLLMARDANAGRNSQAVQAELASVRKRFGARQQ